VRVRERIDGSVPLRRAARRIARRPTRRTAPPARPVGVKLELTHSCNLRCGFCYTDSPRHTLARTADLPDDAWLAIADEAIELGIIEAVVTGGEPLLRRELTLEMLARLDAAGVATNLNTNGWFVDDAVADRLARVRGLTVHLSIDGATPALHDAARGVPGSWRRVVEATDRLLARGVRLHVVHVVTPDNRDQLTPFLEQMWVLGVPTVRLAPVAPVGAAARSARWRVDRRPIEAAARAFRRAHGDAMAVRVGSALVHVLAVEGEQAPAALLVRPGGAVLTDSVHPFVYGSAPGDGLRECWERIRAGWRDPRVLEWARGIHNVGDMHRAPLVSYRDPELDLSPRGDGNGDGAARAAAEPAPRLPRAAAPRDDGGPEAARALVRELALARRYRAAPLRSSHEADGARCVRVIDTGRLVALNPSAAEVMAACAGGSAADAVARLVAAYPTQAPGRLERDAFGALRLLVARDVVRPALAPAERLAAPAAAEPALDLVDL
jgi:MoaA/NifB/PqqE/SkfB family radical SAM enzyme